MTRKRDYSKAKLVYLIEEKYGSVPKLAKLMKTSTQNLHQKLGTQSDNFMIQLKEKWKLNLSELGQSGNFHTIENVNYNNTINGDFKGRKINIDVSDYEDLRQFVNLMFKLVNRHDDELKELRKKINIYHNEGGTV